MNEWNPYGVEKGQVWVSDDPREDSPPFEVLAVLLPSQGAGAVAVVSSHPDKSRPRRIRLERFKAGSTGYRRVLELEPGPEL